MRKSGLAKENALTRMNGITATTRAESFACAVCTRSDLRSASSPLTVSVAACSTCRMRGSGHTAPLMSTARRLE